MSREGVLRKGLATSVDTTCLHFRAGQMAVLLLVVRAPQTADVLHVPDACFTAITTCYTGS